jgi:hypothetical protein
MVRFYESGDETSYSIKARNFLAFWIQISWSKKILHLEYLSSFFFRDSSSPFRALFPYSVP